MNRMGLLPGGPSADEVDNSTYYSQPAHQSLPKALRQSLAAQPRAHHEAEPQAPPLSDTIDPAEVPPQNPLPAKTPSPPPQAPSPTPQPLTYPSETPATQADAGHSRPPQPETLDQFLDKPFAPQPVYPAPTPEKPKEIQRKKQPFWKKFLCGFGGGSN